MGAKTGIPWADATIHPVTGCSPVSEGCRNCYAARGASGRLKHHPRYQGLAEGGKWTGEVRLNKDQVELPLRWKKPRRIFVCSHGDLFHPKVPASWIVHVFETMASAKQHTFLILTKRPERIAPVLYGEEGHWYLGGGDYLKNIWLGVSVEDQETADKRIPELLSVDWPGVTWISAEPLIGPIDLTGWLYDFWKEPAPPGVVRISTLPLSWVVIGCESGSKARPMKESWAKEIIEQCEEAKVPVFFKQMMRNGRKVSLPIFNGRRYAEFPQIIGKPSEQ